MKKHIYLIASLIALTTFSIVGCGEKSSSEKEAKLSELKKIQSEIAALQKKEAEFME